MDLSNLIPEAQQRSRPAHEGHGQGEAILPAAEQRQMGVVRRGLHVLKRTRRHVGRIGHDDVDAPVQIGERGGGGGVGLEDSHPSGRVPLAGGDGGGAGLVGQLDGDHAGGGDLGGDGGRDGTAAGAQENSGLTKLNAISSEIKK